MGSRTRRDGARSAYRISVHRPVRRHPQQRIFEAYYPAGVLENMARLACPVWLHAVLRDLVRTDVFGEIGTGLDARMRRLNWLIAEAARHGLTVYLYLNEPRGMPAGFFSKHPESRAHQEGRATGSGACAPRPRP
jgi:hypothetical protein